MIWTERDEETIKKCREAVHNCEHYHVSPASWFELCLRTYETLKASGMLEEKQLERDICVGCVYDRGGGCLRAYQSAKLDETRTKVVNCNARATTLPEKNRKRTAPTA